MDITVILVFFCTLFLCISLLQRNARKQCNVPGPVAFPLIGSLMYIISTRVQGRVRAILNLHRQYGDMFKINIGSYTIVYICRYNLIYEWLQKKSEVFINRPNWLPLARGIASTSNDHPGIVWANGEDWKKLRRFTLHSLKDFGVGKNTTEERIIEEVQAIVGELKESQEQPICLKQSMTRASLNTIHSVVFGFQYKPNSPQLIALIENITAVFENSSFLAPTVLSPLLRRVFRRPYDKILRTKNAIASYILEQIELHRQSFDANNIRDFIDLYISNESKTDDNIHVDDLLNTIYALFLAGTDTTALTLYWAFLYMVAFPDIQRRCQEEIDKEIGDRIIRLRDRKSLQYTMATISEVQRLGNIAGGTLPRTPSEDIEINGYHIPKGTIVFGLLRTVHLDKASFDNPEIFNPERFLSENGESVSKKFLMPFSIGPRSCPGDFLAKSEVFLIFANILNRFTLEKADQNVNLDPIVTGLTTYPHPYQVIAKSRHIY